MIYIYIYIYIYVCVFIQQIGHSYHRFHYHTMQYRVTFNIYLYKFPTYRNLNFDCNIPHSNISPLNFLGAPVKNSFFCPPSVRVEIIVNLIRRQKNKSTDLTNIPVFIYKNF